MSEIEINILFGTFFGRGLVKIRAKIMKNTLVARLCVGLGLK